MQIHGGDIYNNKVRLDFSANINPFGMPDSIRDAAIEGVKQSMHYPDMICRKLREAIGEKEQIAPEHIICGNGAAEVIFSLVNAVKPKQALLVQPTFVEYEQALRAVDCQCRYYQLSSENDFAVTQDLLTQLDESLDMMFLCNPNNPTGYVVEQKLLVQILERCQQMNILLVMDECFQDFLSEEDEVSMKEYLPAYSNLFILKAFTKMYGMAGLRLGYGLSSNQMIFEKMKAVTQSWNVSIPAQYAGIAACKEDGIVKETREYVAKELEYLKQALCGMGMKVYASKANYIFFQGPKGLYEQCLKQGILIRSCQNYVGLDKTYYRIAVKKHEENIELIEAIKNNR